MHQGPAHVLHKLNIMLIDTFVIEHAAQISDHTKRLRWYLYNSLLKIGLPKILGLIVYTTGGTFF